MMCKKNLKLHITINANQEVGWVYGNQSNIKTINSLSETRRRRLRWKQICAVWEMKPVSQFSDHNKMLKVYLRPSVLFPHWEMTGRQLLSQCTDPHYMNHVSINVLIMLLVKRVTCNTLLFFRCRQFFSSMYKALKKILRLLLRNVCEMMCFQYFALWMHSAHLWLFLNNVLKCTAVNLAF